MVAGQHDERPCFGSSDGRHVNTGQADAILMAREFFASRIGRCAPRRDFGNRFYGRCNISAPRRETRTRVFPLISTG